MARKKNLKMPKLDVSRLNLTVKYRGLPVIDCQIARGGKFEVKVDALGEQITQVVELSRLEFYAHGDRLRPEDIVGIMSAN